jgi:hypothetical protein
MPHSDLFFSDEDSFAVQQHLKAAIESEIAGIDGNRLLNTNVEDLVTYIVDKYRLDIPVLDEANVSVDQQEAKRDVSGDPQRMAYHFGRATAHVTGTEVIVEVPFTGDFQMFRIQPSTYRLHVPQCRRFTTLGIIYETMAFEIWIIGQLSLFFSISRY